MRHVGISWQIGTTFGWGVYGYQIALELLRQGILPALFETPGPLHLDLLEQRSLAPAQQFRQQLVQMIERHGEGQIGTHATVLHARGNNCDPQFGAISKRLRGSANHGLIFFENTRFQPAALEALAAFDQVVAGSTWNGEVLRAQGLGTVVDNIQGVEPALFHPARRRDLFPGRFVIFSGGKLEFRKGQDLVVAAVRAFRQRHPETLLLTAWHTYWPRSVGVARLAQSPHLTAPPTVDAKGALETERWLAANGLPPESVLILPDVPNGQMPQLLREADAAIFPNRCEGGTNLVAMETMACGVPSLVSANTGHLDLLGAGAGIALARQDAVPSAGADDGTEGWGESSVEEIVEGLERVWADRAAARQAALEASAAMHRFSWRNQTGRLLEMLGLSARAAA